MQAEEAAWQRAEADSRFGAVHEELQQERGRIAQIEVGALCAGRHCRHWHNDIQDSSA